MEISSFVDGLLIGLLVSILFFKIREDRQMKKVGEIKLTKEESKKILEDMLKQIDKDVPMERNKDDE